MRLLALTPIHVPDAEVARRQARYDAIAPAGVAVVVRRPDGRAAARARVGRRHRGLRRRAAGGVRRGAGGDWDGFLPDCVLDPAVHAADRAAGADPRHRPAGDARARRRRAELARRRPQRAHRPRARPARRRTTASPPTARRPCCRCRSRRSPTTPAGGARCPRRWPTSAATPSSTAARPSTSARPAAGPWWSTRPRSRCGCWPTSPASRGRRMSEADGPDLVVAGAGGGLAGALRAAQLGLDVLVVERQEHFAAGNNTAMSTAMVPGAGSRFQREAGIEDSPDQFLDDVRAKTGGRRRADRPRPGRRQRPAGGVVRRRPRPRDRAGHRLQLPRPRRAALPHRARPGRAGDARRPACGGSAARTGST